MIKKIEKPKKDKKKTIAYWQKKADKKLQEIARDVYADKGCMICGGEYSCVHHYIPKSRSTALRYDWDNLIPICARCHQTHHCGDATVHARVDLLKGEEWLENLLAKQKQGIGIKANWQWYKNKFESLDVEN
jgi:5-methylcytosine-specific restriction endonuclease McrA